MLLKKTSDIIKGARSRVGGCVFDFHVNVRFKQNILIISYHGYLFVKHQLHCILHKMYLNLFCWNNKKKKKKN